MPNDIELGIAGIGPATLLARGGSAYVYLAEQTDFGRQVAVKVLFEALEDEATIRRFDRECRAIGAVSAHPNIVVVHGRGLTADDRPYLIMEHRAGGSLAERLLTRGTLTEAEVLHIGITIGGALGVAHEAGVVHRDVKPANILLSAYGEPALADFGIARIDGGHKTTQGVFSASVLHASREVLDSGEPTARSDIYSLASTMFELLTGRAPFADPTDDSMWAVVSRVLTTEAPDPAEAGVSAGMAAALRRALSHDPEARHPTASAFVAELEAVRAPASADEHTVRAAAPGGGIGAPTAVIPRIDLGPPRHSEDGARPPAPVDGDGPTRSRSRGVRRVVSVAAVGAVVAAGAVAALALAGGDPSPSDDGTGSETTTAGSASAATGDDPVGATAADDGPRLRFRRAEIGPLQATERYALDVVESPDGARYRILVDGVAVTELEDEVPIYFPEAGRHELVVEIHTDEDLTTTTPIDVYVSGRGPEPGYRANLASIRSLPENWPEALRLYDRLVADGHEELELDLSTRQEENALPFWNYYVDGFGDDRGAAQAYCDGFGLDTDSCFVARVSAGP